MVSTTAAAEAGEIALTLDFTLNLKPAANFAFTLNASLLFVVGTAIVVMGVTHDSARVDGRSTRKISAEVDFSLLALVVAAMLGGSRKGESSCEEGGGEDEEFFLGSVFSTKVVVLVGVTENLEKEFKQSSRS